MIKVKAKAMGGPIDGQTVVANGNTVHVPVARTGRPAEVFIYQLIDYRHEDGRQEWILRPMEGTG